MTDELTPPEPWDLPVVRALDAIEFLPGLDPDLVEFDQFRLPGVGLHGPMDSATIYAYQPIASARFTVKFAVRGTTYEVRDRDRRQLTASGVADLLHVPLASADRALTLLKTGLTESLRIYNQANHPPHRTTAHRAPFAPDTGPRPWTPGDRPAVPGADTRDGVGR